MRKPRVSGQQANRASERPATLYGHEVVIDMLVMYDSRDEAETLAEKLGTYAKHSRPRFDNSIWRAFSIVKLPG